MQHAYRLFVGLWFRVRGLGFGLGLSQVVPGTWLTRKTLHVLFPVNEDDELQDKLGFGWGAMHSLNRLPVILKTRWHVLFN
jgi:hypothetical protein